LYYATLQGVTNPDHAGEKH